MELKGHSGCTLKLITDKNFNFVRKTSKNIEYNDRLKIQSQKQGSFQSSIISTPQVLDCGYKDDLFYFDMEHIPGKTLAASMLTDQFSYIESVFHKILLYLNFQNTSSGDQSNKVIEKIHSLQLDEKYSPYLNELEKKVFKLGISYCHGDLTLENIILYKDKIYFIDFLDSFVDSKFIDFAKLFQDIYCFWSWRKGGQKPISECVKLSEMLINNLGCKGYEKTVYFLILNLLRILPYSKDSEIIKLIDNSLKKICPL